MAWDINLKADMTGTTVRPIQTRLFFLLLRAFTAAVLFITVVIFAAIAYYLTNYPTNFNPIERLPIITRLETFYLVKDNWQGVEVLPQNDLSSDFHGWWNRSILLDAQGKVLLDHGSAKTPLTGTSYTKTPNETIIPILAHEHVVATLLLDASFLPARRQVSLDFLLPIGMISLLMAIPTVIIGLFLMRRFVTPLAEVIAAARAVASGDLSARVRASGPDDLRALSDSFNQMAASLEQSDSERRNMLADIAHELRTPITVMRGRLEGIVDGVYAASPEQISPALEETYLLERLVEDLRLLTLAETRQLHFERTNVNLREMVARVIDLFQAEAEDKKITLGFDGPDEEAVVRLDPQRIKQVIGNLVSNALRYTPEGGNVTLSVQKNLGNVVLSVSDDGPGVPAEDLASIFQRFWRGEKSRSRTSGGAGLGLAIARQLVEGQGGRIQAENRPQGGLKISIEFPLEA
jgi:two-component system OmpR family sensor kinase/two-component system sensor histidine kinase BaeS